MLYKIGLSHNPAIQSAFRMKGSRNSVIQTASYWYILNHCKCMLSQQDLGGRLTHFAFRKLPDKKKKNHSDYLRNGDCSDYLINRESFKWGGKVGIQFLKNICVGTL